MGYIYCVGGTEGAHTEGQQVEPSHPNDNPATGPLPSCGYVLVYRYALGQLAEHGINRVGG